MRIDEKTRSILCFSKRTPNITTPRLHTTSGSTDISLCTLLARGGVDGWIHSRKGAPVSVLPPPIRCRRSRHWRKRICNTVILRREKCPTCAHGRAVFGNRHDFEGYEA